MWASVEADTVFVLADILEEMNPDVVRPWLHIRNLATEGHATLKELGIDDFLFLSQEIGRRFKVHDEALELGISSLGQDVTFDQLVKAIAKRRTDYPKWPWVKIESKTHRTSSRHTSRAFSFTKFRPQ